MRCAERVLGWQPQLGHRVDPGIDDEVVLLGPHGLTAEEAEAVTSADGSRAIGMVATLSTFDGEATPEPLERAGHPESAELTKVAGAIGYHLVSIHWQVRREDIQYLQPREGQELLIADFQGNARISLKCRW
jgi:hypothetical protein